MPEARVIARQISHELNGKRVVSCVRGNVPHKFAFYGRPQEEYETIFKGKTVREATDSGPAIVVCLEPDYALILGGGGERIRFHLDKMTLPKKHHLLLTFEDETFLTVSVQGWGNVFLLHSGEAHVHPHVGEGRVSPLSDAFTPDYFKHLFRTLQPDDRRSVKYFIVSEPGVWGIGNGYLQDVLFKAKLHPKHQASLLSDGEIVTLYQAIQTVMTQAVEHGGRDTEFDLYNCPGKYIKILDNRTVGLPCPNCKTPIEKTSYLGGTVYYCPNCQV